MVVLLKIGGNCLCLRAKVAHMVGHLPLAEARDVFVNDIGAHPHIKQAGSLNVVLVTKSIGSIKPLPLA